MEYSRLANIVSLRKSIDAFNTTTAVNDFEQDLIELLQCKANKNPLKTKRQFLSKITWILLQQTSLFNNQSVINLKNKAMDVLVSQQANNNNSDTDTNTTTNNNNTDNNNNSIKLESLPTNTIDHFASFLNKRESIRFGYLNRFLFTQTQKDSFLLARQNEPTLIIDKCFNVSYYYCDKNSLSNSVTKFPTSLELSDGGFKCHYNPSSIADSWRNKHFESLFYRVNQLIFRIDRLNFICNGTIPIDLLFNKEKHKTNISLLSITYAGYCTKHDTFATNYSKYFEQICQSNNQLIRQIDTLDITAKASKTSDITYLLLSLSSNYNCLSIRGENTVLRIKNLHQFRTLFHAKLLQLSITSHFIDGLKINIDKIKQQFRDKINSCTNTNKQQNVHMLRLIIA